MALNQFPNFLSKEPTSKEAVRLSTQGFKKKLKTGALIEISKIQTFYLSETVSNTELPLKFL
jgi:hypothetical protein